MKNNKTAWILLTVLALIWGSSFILMKRGLAVFSSEQVAALRIFIAGLCLAPFVVKHFSKIEKRNYKYLFLIGLLGNGIPAFLFTKAETIISSSLAGLLNALTPLFTLIISIIVFKNRVAWINALGLLIGFIGAAGLMLLNNNGDIGSNYQYGLYVVLATVCYGFSVNIIRNYLYGINSLHIAGFALMSVGIPCGIYLFSTNFMARVITTPSSLSAIGYVCILAAMGTALSLVLFNRLIKLSGALFASSVTYFIPIVAILWGLFDGEQVGIIQLIGLLVILSGVYLVNKKKTEIVALKEEIS
jgi:drug/metabolite transporter (DMT)-like permease